MRLQLLFALAALLVEGLAAPGVSPSKKPQCPANALQPDGLLPDNGEYSYHAKYYTLVSRKDPHKIFRVTKDYVKTTPGDICTICTTIVPYYEGMNCDLVFDLPKIAQAGIPYEFNGGGQFTWQPLAGKLSLGKTNWANKPAPVPNPPGFQNPRVVKPGNSYVIRSDNGCLGPDKGGKTVTLTGMLCSKDTKLVYTPTKDRCPVGDFVILSGFKKDGYTETRDFDLPTPPRDGRPNRHQCPPNKYQPDGKLPSHAYGPKSIVQVSAKHPNKSYPHARGVKVTPNDFCSIGILEFPYKPGERIALVFTFPSKDQQGGNFWDFSGPGDLEFSPLSGIPVPGRTTWANKPAAEPGRQVKKNVKPGYSYVIFEKEPLAPEDGGSTITVAGMTCSKNSMLTFKQGGKCPIGPYVIAISGH